MLPPLKRIDRVKTIDNLKDVILITDFGSATVVSELSGNIYFIEDIKYYGGLTMTHQKRRTFLPRGKVCVNL